MFKNLRTSTKLVLLCAMFMLSIIATTYSLVVEHQIAISFARKELVGTKYLVAVRGVFAAVLAEPSNHEPTAPPGTQRDDILKGLMTAQANEGATSQTREIAESLAAALRLWSNNRDNGDPYGYVPDVLAKGRRLVARIADSSNLALDPDLDSYYVQDLITRKLPTFLAQLGELQILSRRAESGQPPANEQITRFRIMEGLLRSITGEVEDNLASAYRGNGDGSLKKAVEDAFATMISSTNVYLNALSEKFVDSNSAGRSASGPDHHYGNVVKSTIEAWATGQHELDRLLQLRINGLVRNLLLSLALTGALVGVSIIIAVMTHQQIVKPLERLENIASTVRGTKDYSLRTDHTSRDEIGRLAAAFNDMLSELAAARERERAEQSEFMHAARLTTMGVMTASIAHEINQPLAAIVANSNAAQRWLSKAQPDLDEARKALKSIANDGHRASQVITSVRSMLKKGGGKKVQLAVNDLIEDILVLVHGEIRKHRVEIQTELFKELPNVVGDRTQLLQVFVNLIRNAVDAMSPVTNRERLLVIKSSVSDLRTVIITVQDSGTGLDSNDTERIFEAFYTTKSDGMGMGLSICRSIIEAHGGRLWASPGSSYGSVFHVVLPSS